MYSHVVLPVDGSSFSEQAIPYALSIVRRAGGRLHVVLVHTPLARHAADIAVTPLFGEWEDRFRERETHYLEDLVARLRESGVDAVATRSEGEVAPKLIERAKSDADLLVMATHGRGGLERAWLGSVADEVVHHVRLPVLLVPAQADEAAPEEATFEHVLVATDGSKAAVAATRQAAEVARLFGARLTLLRVVSVPAGLSSPYIPHAAQLDRETTERRRAESERFLDELAAEVGEETAGVKVETHVELAYHPARGILDAIGEFGCDLVALGTHRRTRLARIVLGSVADKIVRASPVPVLVGHADG